MESEVQAGAPHSLSLGRHGKMVRQRNGHIQGVRNLMLSIFSMKEMPKSSDQSGEQRRKELGPTLGSKEDKNRC